MLLFSPIRDWPSDLHRQHILHPEKWRAAIGNRAIRAEKCCSTECDNGACGDIHAIGMKIAAPAMHCSNNAIMLLGCGYAEHLVFRGKIDDFIYWNGSRVPPMH